MAVKGKWIIPLENIPADTVIHQYILQNTDIQNQIARFDNYQSADYIECPIHVNMDLLEASVKEGLKKFGQHQFAYKDQTKILKSYLSTSLTFNPDAIDKISDDPHKATLGSTQLQFGSASEYDNTKTARNTYNDTLAFKELTPLAQFAEIKNFLSTFKRTLIRSRISSVMAGMDEATKLDFGWHNDENIFLNLRVNIPIQTSANYLIQILSGSAQDAQISEFELKRNFAYVYNTQKYHRPYCKQLDSLDRINMICGISPWFDYDLASKAWISNEYYGEMHPFDMFQKGHITSAVSSIIQP